MADTAPTNDNSGTTETASTPPWGDNFDADRAWALIQNLRAEKETLKTERDAARQELQESTASAATESDKIQAAEKRAQNAEKALWTERALRKHPALEEFADLLSGDSEEDVLARAERLASIGKPKDDKPNEEPGNEPGSESGSESGGQEENGGQGYLPGKPEPHLTPGHGGEETTPFDPVAIAKAARRA